MVARLSFTFYGDRQLDRSLARFSEFAADMRPAWEAIADDFAKVERRQFATEGAAYSGGWPALSPKYGAWKARHYPGRRILARDGDLEASLTQRPFGIEAIFRHLMVIGSDVFYGAFHQHGTGRMPQRRPVEFNESTRRRWVKFVQSYMITGNPRAATTRGGGRRSAGRG